MLGLVCNCSYNALIEGGSVEWLCWPAPDSSFVLGPPLDRERGGRFAIEPVGPLLATPEYLENTNILRTVFTTDDGAFELIDFAPRFLLHDRPFQPSMLVRILRPLDGSPRVRVRWAGARRAAEIGEWLDEAGLAGRGRAAAAEARRLLEERCWNAGLGALAQVTDAPPPSSTQRCCLRCTSASSPQTTPGQRRTCSRRAGGLAVPGVLPLRWRYSISDDFGLPEAAFTVCSFWPAEALQHIGRRDEARRLFEPLLTLHNGLGLYGEIILPLTGQQSGNTPQAYSHVGLINAAFRLSRS